MAKKSDPYLNNYVAQICGLMVGVFIIIPPLIRLNDGQWSSDDWVPVVLGVLITTTWLVLIALGWRQRRRKHDKPQRLQSE